MGYAAPLTAALALMFGHSTPTPGRFAGYYTVTAYCACSKCCGKHADGITASGKPVRSGMIATDWRHLPRGTRVRLSFAPGKTFVVEDKGGAIKGRRIDVFIPSHRDALKFGIRRKTKVWIVRH